MKSLLLLIITASIHAKTLPKLPPDARLALHENWSSGKIDPKKWYRLRKRWGQNNNGVVPENSYLKTDAVNGKKQHVLVCRGHGDQYQGPIKGWHGNTTRVGGVVVTKEFFASGRYEVVMKIGTSESTKTSPADPTQPIGMIPAIWTYGYRWVSAKHHDLDSFHPENPLYNPLMKRQWKSNEYWSEIDFPEFGKNQNLKQGLYNTFLNDKINSQTFDTSVAIDGQYHTFTTIWRTHLTPFPNLKDSQVVKYKDYHWVHDKKIPFESYYGNPLKRLGKDKYALYSGKVASHYIDGKLVGKNTQFVPAHAAQLNLGVWFPKWAGAAPWQSSSASFASIKIWQYQDPGDIRNILTEDITNNMNSAGTPIKPK